MMANSGWNSHEEQPRAASKSFQRHTEHRKPMPDDERFLGSVRRECLDHFLILHEKQLHRLLKTSVMYYNQARPHQGIRQRIPDPPVLSAPPLHQPNQVISIPVFGGLHHTYQRAA